MPSAKLSAVTSRRRFLQGLSATATLATMSAPYAFAVEKLSSDDVVFLQRSDSTYASYRQPFNKRIALEPAVIAVCMQEHGVQRAVEYAKTHNLPIAIKSGGHGFEGYSLNQGGLVVDLSRMQQVQIDGNQQLMVGPGCRLAGLFDYVLPKGRLLPTGSCGGVGIAGLTLGGGYGMFSRKYGLTCDSLVRVRMVDGQGRLHDSRDRADLLWACRGGGNGNFGLITSMQFNTYPAPELLHSYRFKYALSPKRAVEMAARWFALAPQLPPEAFSAFVWGGKTLTILVTTFVREPDKTFLDGPITELRRGADKVFPVHTARLMHAVKRYYGQSKPLYFKNVSAGFYRGFDDIQAVAEEVFQRVASQPGALLQINTFLTPAASQRAQNDAAFPHRGYPFIGELQCYWDQAAREPQAVATVKGIQRLLSQNGIRAHYANYPDIDLENWPEAYFGKENYQRLQTIKSVYDPENRIRHPQSVRLPT